MVGTSSFRSIPWRYAIAVLVTAATVFLRWACVPIFGYQTPYFIAYPVIMVLSVVWGIGPGIAASLVGIYATETWLVEPVRQSHFDWADGVRLAVLFCPVVYLGLVGQRLREARARSQTDANAARISEGRLNHAQQTANLGSWEWDIATGALSWSDQTCRQMGEEPGRFTPSHDEFLRRVHPEDRAAFDTALERALATVSPYDLEFRIVRPDGEVRMLHSHGEVVPGPDGRPRRMVGVCLDITERKRAEEALQQERDRLAALVNSIRDEIWFADAAGRFTLVNPSGSHEFNLEAKAKTDIRQLVAGLEVLRPDGTPRAVEETPPLRALRGEVVTNQEELVRTPATGDLRYRQVSAAPVRDGSGNIIGSVSVVRDITRLKRAEDELRRAKQRLQSMIDSITDGLLVLDHEWRYTYFSEQAARIVGVRPENMVGRVVWDLFPHARGTKFHEFYHRAVATRQPQHFEEFYPEPLSRWLECHCYPSEEGLTVYFRDVTARKEAEAAVIRSQKTFSELVERAPFGVYIVDSQFRIAQMNAGSQAGTFQNVRPVIGRDLAEVMRILWPEPVAADIIAAFRHTLETGEAYYSPRFTNPRHDVGIVESYEWELHRMTLPDGQYGVVCYYFDSTRLRDAEAAARESDERMQQALRVSHSFTFEWQLATDRVLRSESCATILNLAGDDARNDTGQQFFLRVHPDDRTRFVQMLRGLTPAASTYTTEYRVVRHDGSIVVLEEMAQAAFDDAGNLERLVGVTSDITARKQAEEELRRAIEELKRSNKELEAFAYVASHDLQEPLRMVSSFMTLLQERYEPQLDARAREYIGFAVEGAQRMSSLIKDLLAYSRVERMGTPIQPTEANRALARALANLRGGIEEAGAAITQDNLPTVNADPTQLSQLFQNLIGNAVKFRYPDRPCQVHVAVRNEAGRWVFSVRDNGIGIDPRHYERIFMIFQRLHTRNKYPGTGIGLAICKKIVERHGGRIWVESKVGEGATFCFTLPGDAAR
jgi:PAS domain S-box-containing protein